MKTIKRILWTLIILLVAIVVFRDILVKWTVGTAVRVTRGFTCTMESCHVGLWPLGVEIKGMQLTNPPDFLDTRMVTIQQLKVSFPWTSLWNKPFEIKELIVDVPEVVIVRKANGDTNIKRLSGPEKETPKGVSEKTKTGATQGHAKVKKNQRALKISHLHVALGKLELKDYQGHEGKPSVVTAPLNIDHTYGDVTDIALIGAALTLDVTLRAGPQFVNVATRMLKAAPAANDR